jgi:hypothetical protein
MAGAEHAGVVECTFTQPPGRTAVRPYMFEHRDGSALNALE